MKVFNPSVHSVERVRERFGILEENAKQFVNELMATAKYVTTQPDGKVVYKNSDRDTMIVVDERSNTIVTVLPPAHIKHQIKSNNAFYKNICTTVEREVAKYKRRFTKEFRALAEQQALVQLEIAQLTLNKVRCKAPHTRDKIQENIDMYLEKFDHLGTQLTVITNEFERIKAEANEVLIK